MEPLARLFGSPARLKMLRLFFFNQDASFSLDQVATRTKTSSAVTRSELADLTAAGVLRKKGERTSARYQANPKFEHVRALSDFIRETTNVRPQSVVAVLRKAGTLQLVALSGLFTGAIEPQIDLLVVGDVLEERALVQAVRSLEAELGREIRYASFTVADFRYRRGVFDRLLRDVFDYPHRVLVDKIGL
jgi:hypothetical protein